MAGEIGDVDPLAEELAVETDVKELTLAGMNLLFSSFNENSFANAKPR